MPKWFLILICTLLMYDGALGFVLQEPLPQPEYPKRVSYHYDGTLYLNQTVGHELWFSSNGYSTDTKNPVGKNQEPASFSLKEGPAELGFTFFDGSKAIHNVVVDGSAPQSDIVFSNASYFNKDGTSFYGKNLEISLVSQDQYSGIQDIYISINKSQYTPYKGKLDRFDSSREYTIDFYAVDNVGNVEPVQSSHFIVDVVGPTISYSINGPQRLNVLGEDASIRMMAKDDDSEVKEIRYRLNQDDELKYDTPIILNNLTEGTHILSVVSEDNVSNISDTLNYTFYLDNNPPGINFSIDGPIHESNGVTYISSSSRLVLVADDRNSGIDWLKYNINQQGDLDYAGPIALRGESGSYNIAYQSKDVIGNITPLSNQRVYLDNTSPETVYNLQGSYFSEGDQYIISPKTQIMLESLDLESGVEKVNYKVNEGDWQLYSESISFESDGTYRVEFSARDHVGNIEEIQTLYIEIDQSRQFDAISDFTPVARETGSKRYLPEENVMLGAQSLPFYFQIASSPDDTATSYLLHMDVNSKDAAMQFEDEGINYVSLKIGDNNKTFAFKTDDQAPKTDLQLNDALSYLKQDQLIYANDVELTLSAEDAISGVNQILVSEDGGSYQEYSRPLQGFFSEKSYSIRYYATDKVGNEESENLYTFTIDATSPRTRHRVVNNYSGNTLSPHTVMELDATDNLSGISQTFMKIDGGEYRIYDGQFRLSEFDNIVDNMHTLYYYSVDHVGNAESENRYNFRYDNEIPIVTHSWQGNYHNEGDRYYINPETKLVLNANEKNVDIRNIWFSKDNQEAVTYHQPVSIDANGNFIIVYGAEDVVGNKSKATSLQITRDELPPRTGHSYNGTLLNVDSYPIIGRDAEIILSSTDSHSGVQRIIYRLNNGNEIQYNSPISFNASGDTRLSYYSIDQVGNSEETRDISFLVDNTSPEINISYNTSLLSQDSDENLLIEPHTLLSIKAIDNHTDVSSLYYQIDDQEPRLYVNPLTNFRSNEAFILTVTATDLMGNVNTITKKYRVLE
ncbi:MAG: hypothetical protein WD267_10435 [Balneolales bacterium]